MDIVKMITEMYMPMVLVACLAIGYVVKKWIKDVDNKYIPTICFALGCVFACVTNQKITFDVIVSGGVSGLASTGLHQAFKQIVEGDDKQL